MHQFFKDDAVATAATPSTVPTRAEMPAADTWDLAALYPDPVAWQLEFARVREDYPKLGEHKGRLGGSAAELLAALEFDGALSRRIEILSGWVAFSQRFPVIIAPVSTDLPFEVGADIAGPDAVDEIWNAHRMLVAPSCLGLPSLAVPLGTETAGMPEGVQLIGPRFGELLCLAAGRDLEREVGALQPIDPRPAPLG